MKTVFAFLFFVLVMAGCKQSDPTEVLARQGDVVHFSGRAWDVKHSATPVGPGPNYFSRFYDDVWVDEHGYLHLTIDKHDNIWYSSEVVSEDTMGYGKYTFTVQADLLKFSDNVVFGLFTWNDSSFYTDANSEIDIEFSKWDDSLATNMATYSVQPVNFGTYYAERTHKQSIDTTLLRGVTTHEFTWTDTLLTWKSYRGATADGPVIGSWSFNLNHPPRVKVDGGSTSLPVVIPQPRTNTHTRMNLWFLPYSGTGPNNQLTHEVVIQKFTYQPF